MRWRDLCVLLFLFVVVAASSLLGQQDNGSLGLQGEGHTSDWNIRTSFQLGSVLLFSGDSKAGAILPDSVKTRREMEGKKGSDLYYGFSLYSQSFRLEPAMPSLRIPVQYHITLTSLRTAKSEALATVFVDLLDAKADTVVARLLGHGIEAAGGANVDSTYSEQVMVSEKAVGEDSMWTISGGEVSMADLKGRNLRVRLTVLTDPVIVASGMQFEAKNDSTIKGHKSLE